MGGGLGLELHGARRLTIEAGPTLTETKVQHRNR